MVQFINFPNNIGFSTILASLRPKPKTSKKGSCPLSYLSVQNYSDLNTLTRKIQTASVSEIFLKLGIYAIQVVSKDYSKKSISLHPCTFYFGNVFITCFCVHLNSRSSIRDDFAVVLVQFILFLVENTTK